jgi:lysyl-tRNA synthetase class 1
LAGAPAGASSEVLQNLVFEAGKSNGFAENLRQWFQAIYEVLLGESQGPRFGSFIELYGIEETRALIAKGLNGDLARAA